MSKEAIYVGSGKKPENFDLINISIAESKVVDYWKEYNGERYLRLVVTPKRQKDEYGKTHSVRIDTWEPSPKAEDAQPSKNVYINNGNESNRNSFDLF